MDNIFVVIDGNSLINRGYYAIQKPMITKEGIYTQGIYAFLSMLSKIKNDYKPTHMLVAFDRKAPTFRHLEYDGYKAGRKGMPIELAMEMPILKDILDAMGIARYEIDGFEADDILGTASSMAEEEDFKTYIITGDRDALQLATDKTSVVINKKGMTEFKLYDDAAMMDEYGFNHIQFIDYKALRGDTSDNIPGIPGVGEKTATALIQQFGSLENIIAGSNEIANLKLRDKVESYAMQAVMSKRLATIVKNVPLDRSMEDFRIKEEDTSKLIEIYTKLEFKSYLSKLLANTNTVISPSDNFIEPNYPKLIKIYNVEEAKEILDNQTEIFIDFDCDNNHVEKASLYSLFLLCDEKVYSFDFQDLTKDTVNLFDKRSIKLAGNRIGIFIYFLINNNCDISNINVSFDCAVANYVISQSSKESTLDELLFEKFHIKLDSKDANIQQSLFDNRSDDEIIVKRIVLTKELSKVLATDIQNYSLETIYYGIELPLIIVLADMEASGFKISREYLSSFGLDLRENINKIESEIYDLAGCKFNINSPKQLGNILFEKLELPSGKKTKNGYSTNAEVLEKLANDYPIVDKILEYRTYSKLASTYIDGMIPLIASDGKIHPHFQQTVTATGRISCTEPNLQNIPVRSSLGKKLRKAFTASSPDNVLVGADYSQIELRVLASMSGDETLISDFNLGKDIHRETAARILGIPAEKVTQDERSKAKSVVFGVIYGMSSFGLSNEIQISNKEAEKYISDYFKHYPDVKSFLDKCIDVCKKNGEITTLYGRRRVVPEINSSNYMVRQLGERLAKNTPVQGTAADIIKIAMNMVHGKLKEVVPSAKLILQIHDELIIDTPKQYEDIVGRILEESMVNAADLAVRLSVSKSSSYNWYDLK